MLLRIFLVVMIGGIVIVFKNKFIIGIKRKELFLFVRLLINYLIIFVNVN